MSPCGVRRLVPGDMDQKSQTLPEPTGRGHEYQWTPCPRSRRLQGRPCRLDTREVDVLEWTGRVRLSGGVGPRVRPSKPPPSDVVTPFVFGHLPLRLEKCSHYCLAGSGLPSPPTS